MLDALCALALILLLSVLILSLGSLVEADTALLEKFDIDAGLRIRATTQRDFSTTTDSRTLLRNSKVGLYEVVGGESVFKVQVSVDELSRNKACQFSFFAPYREFVINSFPKSATPVDGLLFDTELFVVTDATSTFSDPDLFLFEKRVGSYELVSSIDTGYGSARLAYHGGLIHIAQNFASHQFDTVQYQNPDMPYIQEQIKLPGSAVARGKSIIRIGSYVYIGTTHNPDGPELFAYDVSGAGARLVDSLEIAGSVNDLASVNATIFVATTNALGELMSITLDTTTGAFIQKTNHDLARGSGSVRTLGVSTSTTLVGMTVGSNELKIVGYDGDVIIERDIDTTVDDVVSNGEGWIVAVNRVGEEIQVLDRELRTIHTISLGSRVKALRCHKNTVMIIFNNSQEIRMYSNS